MTLGIRDSGLGTRGSGFGTRGSGFEVRDRTRHDNSMSNGPDGFRETAPVRPHRMQRADRQRLLPSDRVRDRSGRHRDVHGVGSGLRNASLPPGIADSGSAARWPRSPRPHGAGHGRNGRLDHLLEMGPAVRRAHEPGGDADLLPSRQSCGGGSCWLPHGSVHRKRRRDDAGLRHPRLPSVERLGALRGHATRSGRSAASIAHNPTFASPPLSPDRACTIVPNGMRRVGPGRSAPGPAAPPDRCSALPESATGDPASCRPVDSRATRREKPSRIDGSAGRASRKRRSVTASRGTNAGRYTPYGVPGAGGAVVLGSGSGCGVMAKR